MKKEAFRFEIVLIIAVLVSMVVAVVTSILSLTFHTDRLNVLEESTAISEYATGWNSPKFISSRLDTSSLNANVLYVDKPTVFTKVLNDLNGNESLFISSHNLVINVLLDGKMIYKTSETGNIDGLDGFENHILVSLPENADGKELSLEIFKTRYSVSARIDRILIGSGSAVVKSLILEGTFPMVVGEFLFFIGIGFVLLGVFVRKKLDSYLGNIFFGIFLMFMSVCIVLNTAWVHIVINNPIYIEKTLRICHLACMPPFLAFIDSSYETEHYYPIKIFAVVISFTMAVMMIMDMIGIISIISLGLVIHLLMILCGVIVSFELLIFKLRVKDSGSVNGKIGYIAVFVLVIMGSVDIMVYYNRSFSGNEMLMSCFGVLFITAVMLRTRFVEMLKMIKLGIQAGKIGKIAFTDANTGIGNAAAFKSKFDELEATRQNYKYIGIIQFDVNNLKKINDTKGHDAGDLLIKSAANIINGSFGISGNCYRTGGDEFVAIISNDHAPIACEEAIYKFNKLIDKFNANPDKPFELRIAHGVAYYQNDKNEDLSLKEVHKMADERMYSNKKMLKARYAHTAEEAEVR